MFLTSEFSELKSRGAENEKQLLPKFVLGCLSSRLFEIICINYILSSNNHRFVKCVRSLLPKYSKATANQPLSLICVKSIQQSC